MRIARRNRPFVLVALVFWWTVGAAAADAAEIADFFGRYEGTATAALDSDVDRRDLAVSIEPRATGFNVTWTTVRHTGDDRVKKKTYSIDFERTTTPSIFQSAMRKDMFGNRVPLDPLKGDPYVWATLYGDTLTVYALLVSDQGEYELQQYDRTLVPGGLRLDFTRIREGEEVRRITADLKKVGG